MEELNITLTDDMIKLVPIVAVVLQVLKNMEFMQKITQWMPFVSIGVALGLGYLTKMPDPIVPSVVIGLVASGAYDLVKGTIKTA